MFKVLIRLLHNENGFTATEYGIMAALTLIVLETMATKR